MDWTTGCPRPLRPNPRPPDRLPPGCPRPKLRHRGPRPQPLSPRFAAHRRPSKRPRCLRSRAPPSTATRAFRRSRNQPSLSTPRAPCTPLPRAPRTPISRAPRTLSPPPRRSPAPSPNPSCRRTPRPTPSHPKRSPSPSTTFSIHLARYTTPRPTRRDTRCHRTPRPQRPPPSLIMRRCSLQSLHP